MRLVLGKDFPAVPPKGYFLTKIFHPNVGHKGEICVNVLKRDWKAELGLRHVLLVSRALGPFLLSASCVASPLQHLNLLFKKTLSPPADNKVSSHPSKSGVCSERGGRAFAVRGLCGIRVPRSSAHGDPRHGRVLRGTSGPQRRPPAEEARRRPPEESGTQRGSSAGISG